MVCGKCNRNNTNAVCYCNSCFQNARIKSKEEGRVEGAIEELKDTLTTLKAIDNILDCHESAESLKLLIRIKEKRLKSLENDVNGQ